VKYRLYSPTAMTYAYMAVKNHNMSVRKAARQFSVPRQTLKDRTIGKIDADCVTTGRVPVLSMEEEAKLVESCGDEQDYSENIILRLLAVVHLLN
jgi:hypothetical protein